MDCSWGSRAEHKVAFKSVNDKTRRIHEPHTKNHAAHCLLAAFIANENLRKCTSQSTSVNQNEVGRGRTFVGASGKFALIERRSKRLKELGGRPPVGRVATETADVTPAGSRWTGGRAWPSGRPAGTIVGGTGVCRRRPRANWRNLGRANRRIKKQ